MLGGRLWLSHNHLVSGDRSDPPQPREGPGERHCCVIVLGSGRWPSQAHVLSSQEACVCFLVNMDKISRAGVEKRLFFP